MEKLPIDQSQEVSDKILEFMLKKSGFLLMSGKNGTGKTYAATRIGYYFERKLPLDMSGDSTIFLTQSEMNIKWNSCLPEIDYFFEKLCKCGALTIDDLGTRTPTDSFMDFLYAVVDRRWRNSSPTIITTNLTAKQMREMFGEAFFSRVASGTSVIFEGRDRRFDK